MYGELHFVYIVRNSMNFREVTIEYHVTVRENFP